MPPMNRILLVEDHAAMRELVLRELQQAGVAIDAVGRVSEAETCLSQARYAALVLDRGLPDGDPQALRRSSVRPLRVAQDVLDQPAFKADRADVTLQLQEPDTDVRIEADASAFSF